MSMNERIRQMLEETERLQGLLNAAGVTPRPWQPFSMYPAYTVAQAWKLKEEDRTEVVALCAVAFDAEDEERAHEMRQQASVQNAANARLIASAVNSLQEMIHCLRHTALQRDEARGHANDLQARIDAKEERLHELQTEIRALEAEVSKQKQLLDVAHAFHDVAVKERDYERALNARQASWKTLHTECSQLKAAVQGSGKILTAIGMTLGRHDGLVEAVKAIKEERDALLLRLEDAEESAGFLRDALRWANADISRLKSNAVPKEPEIELTIEVVQHTEGEPYPEFDFAEAQRRAGDMSKPNVIALSNEALRAQIEKAHADSGKKTVKAYYYAVPVPR